MTSQSDKPRIDTAALLAAVDIVAVIDARVALKKSGVEYEACCPFHSESTPSFKVSPTKQIYHCFGCGANGDAIHFLQEYEGLKFADACRALGWIDTSQGTPAAVQAAAPRQPVQRESRKEHKVSPWTAIIPAPENAPEPPRAHVVRGLPEATWCYRDAAGATVGYVYRFGTSDGGKETLPLLWARNSETGEHKWHWKAFPEPRPLYGLDRLAARPEATVLVVEGEKCADAGHAELPDLVVVSWPGGGKAVRKADWLVLTGRRVVLWADCDAKRVTLTKAEREALPDELARLVAQTENPLLPEADQPGVKAMATVAEILLGLGCKLWQVRIPAPGEVADGWDIADAVAEGMTGEALAAWVRERSELVVVDDLPTDVPADAESTSPPPPAGAGPWMEFSDDSWRSLLLRKDGRLIDCRENVFLLLQHHPAWSGVLAADTFAKKIIQRKKTPWGVGDDAEWKDADNLELGLWLAHQERLIVRSVDNIALATAWNAGKTRIHPVVEYLQSLVWDGVPRLADWLTDCLGVQRTPYSALVGRMWLIGMVARVMRPGCIMRHMPVLEGVQYRGKSTALRNLVGKWFSDTPLDLRSKDAYQNIQGVWLNEWAELDALNRAEDTAFKAFISSPTDRFRAPYDRSPLDHPRQTVFAGSTNKFQYGKDPTGNTRLWPLRCEQDGDIQLDLVLANRDQLWAEAMGLYLAGDRWHPTNEEQAELFGPEQEKRSIEDSWDVLIYRYLENPARGRVYMLDLLCDCLAIDKGKISPTHSESKRVGGIMDKLGWARKRESSGARLWYYQRPAGFGSEQPPAKAGNGYGVVAGGEHAPF